nr:MAG TPA: hypothetical protein [Caudoviricetes sp.]
MRFYRVDNRYLFNLLSTTEVLIKHLLSLINTDFNLIKHLLSLIKLYTTYRLKQSQRKLRQ